MQSTEPLEQMEFQKLILFQPYIYNLFTYLFTENPILNKDGAFCYTMIFNSLSIHLKPLHIGLLYLINSHIMPMIPV